MGIYNALLYYFPIILNVQHSPIQICSVIVTNVVFYLSILLIVLGLYLFGSDDSNMKKFFNNFYLSCLSIKKDLISFQSMNYHLSDYRVFCGSYKH